MREILELIRRTPLEKAEDFVAQMDSPIREEVILAIVLKDLAKLFTL